ncbi:MAG TPA: carboxypeptidase-like regulatory domain-containing protein, partial [Lacibacter sp.]|nr:carboxypeptidase-like regulatory domain-containing protein [Lacibacter sp.]
MKYLRQPKLLLLTVFSFLTVALFAQEVTVSGTVTNKETGEPLEGVSVKVKNTTTGTTTGKDGSFTIKAPSSESILSFSFVGFSVFELKAGNGSLVLTIPMAKTDTDLDEVVVVGYSTQKRNRVTGAISVVKASDIQDIPSPNIAGALRGRVAGLSVSQASGKPGAGITLNIRNSATSETAQLLGVTDEPLYVIDNITVTKEAFDNLDPS